jgi:DNA-3-methyladenine glycosylase
MKRKLPIKFFQNPDTLHISQNLLGKYLVSSIGNKITSGMIVETEGYLGIDDRASHAFSNRRTNRTEILFLPGGHLYVYLCYGIHSLLNIVTGKKNVPHGILIRAIEPCDGIEWMLERRHMKKINYSLTSGPGSLSKAMGITYKLSGEVIGKHVWVEDRGVIISQDQILITPRIGVDYAKEHALLPYRFEIKDNPWVTKHKFKKEIK